MSTFDCRNVACIVWYGLVYTHQHKALPFCAGIRLTGSLDQVSLGPVSAWTGVTVNVCLRQHSLESMLTAVNVSVADMFRRPLSVSTSRW